MNFDTEMLENLSNELNSFKVILNEIGAYIYTKDLEGNYTYANSLVLKLFKVSLEEVVGKDDSHFFDLKISTELKDNDRRVLEFGEIIEKEELNIIKATGETRIYWTVKKPLYDSEGNISGMCGISTDITERKRLEQKVLKQKKLLDIILNNVDAYVYMKDSNRVFRYVNAKVASLFGKKAEDIIGKKDTDVLPKEIADTFWEVDEKVFRTNSKQAEEESFVDNNGEKKYYWSIKLPYEDDDNEAMLIGFSTDITDIQELKEELRKQTITDSLTELYNRRYFVRQCELEFKKAKRHNLDMSIIIIDLDLFKSVNDTYGHLAGDSVLQRVSKNIQLLLREEDVLCRIGGEEFAIILPHTNKEEAALIAQRIRVYQEETPIIGEFEGELMLTLSLGISSSLKEDETYLDIFMRADNALYKSKEQGRNRVYLG